MSVSWFQFNAPVGGLDTCSTVYILSENESFFFSFPVPSYHHPLSFSSLCWGLGLLVRPPLLLPPPFQHSSSVWVLVFGRKVQNHAPPQLRLGPRTWGTQAAHFPLKLQKIGVPDRSGGSWIALLLKESPWPARIWVPQGFTLGTKQPEGLKARR